MNIRFDFAPFAGGALIFNVLVVVLWRHRPLTFV